jgi:hypothetical protein
MKAEASWDGRKLRRATQSSGESFPRPCHMIRLPLRSWNSYISPTEAIPKPATQTPPEPPPNHPPRFHLSHSKTSPTDSSRATSKPPPQIPPEPFQNQPHRLLKSHFQKLNANGRITWWNYVPSIFHSSSTFDVDSNFCVIRSVRHFLESTFDVESSSTFDVDSNFCVIRSVRHFLESTFDVDKHDTSTKRRRCYG